MRRLRESVTPKNVPIDEEFLLDPVQKFLRYRIVPMKAILNVAILALLLVFAFGIQLDRDEFVVKSRFGLASMFFAPSDMTDSALKLQMTRIEQFVDFVGNATLSYYSLPERSSGVYMHYVYSRASPQPIAPQLTLRFHEGSVGSANFDRIVERAFNTSWSNPIGPFNNLSLVVSSLEPCTPESDDVGNEYIPCRNSTMGDFFDQIISASLTFPLRGLRIRPSSDRASIVKWSIAFDFVFTAHNSVVSMTSSFGSQETQVLVPLAMNLCLALVPLTLWDIILRLRFFQRYHLFVSSYVPQWLMSAAMGNRKGFMREWERKQMRRAGRGWAIFGIFSDALVLVFCVLAFVDNLLPISNSTLQMWQTLLLGSSTMTCCLLLISYLQTSPRLYVLMKALSTALPHLFLYLVGVFPIFVGYAICGMAVFGGYVELFNTLPNAMVTLFCALNGDSLLDIFTLVDQSDFAFLRLFSRIYFATFLGLFICNVLNIALSIVQDAYTHVKEVFQACSFDQEKTEEALVAGGEEVKSATATLTTPSSSAALSRKDLEEMRRSVTAALNKASAS